MDPLKPGSNVNRPQPAAIPARPPVVPPVAPVAPAAAPAAAPAEPLRSAEAAHAALLAGTELLAADAIAAAFDRALPVDAPAVPPALATAQAHGRLSARQVADWAAVREALPPAARAAWDAWAVEGSGPATFATPAGRELLSIAADLLKPGAAVPGGGSRSAYLASLVAPGS